MAEAGTEHVVVSTCLRGGRWQVRRDVKESLLGPSCPDWFHLEADPQARLIKRGHQRSVWCVEHGGETLFVKVFEPTGLTGRLRILLSADPARREWVRGREAARRGVPAPSFLAVGVRPVGVRRAAPARAVLISRQISDAVTLPEWWFGRVARLEGKDRWHAARPVIRAVAELYALGHHRGVVHADGHARNILVRVSEDSLSCAFVDLGLVRCGRRPASVRTTVYSLGQLDHFFQSYASRAERMRFFRHYLAVRTAGGFVCEGKAGRRHLLRRIAAVVERIHQRLARQRDRRLSVQQGSYFATLSLGGGWTARVVVKLSRRYRFPDGHITDRSVDAWRTLLEAMPQNRNPATLRQWLRHQGISGECRRARSWVERLRWTLAGSPQQRYFDHSHRLRHRDLPNEPALGCLVHHTAGLVDETILLRPANPGEAADQPAPRDS